MIIDGHVVKTSNNYVVTGVNYVHGAYKADEPTVKKPAASFRPVIKGDAPPTTKQPRKVADHVTRRLAHNEAIRKRMQLDDKKRLDFMAENCDALGPFVEDKVKRRLSSHRALGGWGKRGTKVGTTVPLGSQPDSVITPLRDYQMIGLDWMVKLHNRGVPFILGDEMGLGKTLQTISLIAHLKENVEGHIGPTLVIVPLSVLYSWIAELNKHAPSLKHFRFHASDPKEREDQKHIMMHDIISYDVVVTTYEMAKNPAVASLISSTYFNLCVLDEGHVIKSMTSQIAESVRKIHCQCKVILTGTPMQNNLVELYAILNYLYPQYFTTPTLFESAFDIGHNRIDPDMLLKANKLLKLFMIRRLKDEVEKLMPKKIETKILCPLSSSQVFWYKGFLMNEIESLVRLTEAQDGDGDPNASAGKHTMLRNLIMQLRKACLHPYLFDFAEPDAKTTSVEELIATSGKLAVLDKLLLSMFKNGHRTCIFSQFTSMLDILEDYCALRGWRYCRFDGSTPRAQRNHIINQFNAPGSQIFIFLMSTRSGGLGINLQTADTCILYDSDWNPQPDLQAMARVHRIGQTKTVHVYRLLSAGTVEERIVERAEKKLYLDQMVNRGTSNRDMEDAGLSTSELLASLKFGSNAVFSSSNDLPTDSDIEKVTNRNRSEDCSDGNLKGGATQTASGFDKNKELTDTRQFCGVDFRKLREEKEAREKEHYHGKSLPNGKGKLLDKLKQHWKIMQTGESIDEMGKGKRDRKSRLIQVKSDGSGLGPFASVLRMNDYDLQSGEPSSWGRETKKIVTVELKRTVHKFINQDFCQICGDGGMLIECPRCPVSVHAICCGLKVHEFQSCTHHHCVECGKSAGGAGGLIYRCQSCPNAYCPDCMPKEGPHRYLGMNVPRFEKLDFQGNRLYYYIHCSEQCEEVARVEFGFRVDNLKPKLPPSMDVTFAFGKDALDVKDLAKKFKEVAEVKLSAVASPNRTRPPGSAYGASSPRKRTPTAKAMGKGGVVDLSDVIDTRPSTQGKRGRPPGSKNKSPKKKQVGGTAESNRGVDSTHVMGGQQVLTSFFTAATASAASSKTTMMKDGDGELKKSADDAYDVKLMDI